MIDNQISCETLGTTKDNSLIEAGPSNEPKSAPDDDQIMHPYPVQEIETCQI